MSSSFMARTVRLTTILSATALLIQTGCSSYSEKADAAADAADAVDLIDPDSSASDVRQDATDNDDHSRFDADGMDNDVYSLDGGDIDVLDAAPETSFSDTENDDGNAPCPGSAGCECSSGNDCDNGLCVPTAESSECTVECGSDSDCENGWICAAVPRGGVSVKACVDQYSVLCRPCRSDADCIPRFGARSRFFACVQTGPAGMFCAAGCAVGSDCPDGYECRQTATSTGMTGQCMRTDNQCPCTAKFAENAWLTDCYEQNESGKCYGTRTCDSECSADTPTFESCNGEDDNCNGKTDEEDSSGCLDYYFDGDDDAYGTGSSRCLCAPDREFSTTKNGDCNDDDDSINPEATQRCNSGYDENCNGIENEPGAEDCIEYFRDHDGDGHGIAGDSQCLCWPEGEFGSRVSDDCNDDDVTVYPENLEKCNSKDDDCDGLTDPEFADGCDTYFKDDDGDRYGTPESRCLCAPSAPFTATRPCIGSTSCDCSDVNADINPGRLEQCNNNIDDDCDGETDEEGAVGCEIFFQDADADGFGYGQGRCLCGWSPEFPVKNQGDCNDIDGEVNPDSPEICNNGKDDNCDWQQDTENARDCSTYYYDADGDGWGVSGLKKCLCSASGFYRVGTGNDCNDLAAQVNPGQVEICNNGLDDDCDMHIDNGPGTLNAKCNICGDGMIDDNEVCDHGNSNPGIACASNCRSIPCSNEPDATVHAMRGTVCYWRTTSTSSRDGAQGRCQERLGYLVRPDSTSERDWVFDNLIFPEGSGSRVWIGARRCGENWCWDDGGAVGSEWTWRPGEPSGNGDCAQSSGSGVSYDDLGCGNDRDYVCERHAPGTPR